MFLHSIHCKNLNKPDYKNLSDPFIIQQIIL